MHTAAIVRKNLQNLKTNETKILTFLAILWCNRLKCAFVSRWWYFRCLQYMCISMERRFQLFYSFFLRFVFDVQIDTCFVQLILLFQFLNLTHRNWFPIFFCPFVYSLGRNKRASKNGCTENTTKPTHFLTMVSKNSFPSFLDYLKSVQKGSNFTHKLRLTTPRTTMTVLKFSFIFCSCDLKMLLGLFIKILIFGFDLFFTLFTKISAHLASQYFFVRHLIGISLFWVNNSKNEGKYGWWSTLEDKQTFLVCVQASMRLWIQKRNHSNGPTLTLELFEMQ